MSTASDFVRRHAPGLLVLQVAAVLFSMYITAAAQTVQDIAVARAAMARGLAAIQAGDPTSARRDFAQVVKLAPNIEPGHAALGSVLLDLHQYEAAIHELEIAHRLAPDDVAASLNLGRALSALRRYDEAILAFKMGLAGSTVTALSPDEALAYATDLAATAQLPESTDVLRSAVASSPDSAELQDGLGTVLAQQGKIEESLPHFDRAASLKPDSGQAQLHLAAALLVLNRPADAASHAEAAVSAMPESFDAQLQLGRALSALHRDLEALAHLHRAAELRNSVQSPDAIYSLALALQASGDAKASLPLFEQATSKESVRTGFDRSSALINYALARVLTGDAAGALPLYAEALARGTDTATLREDYGAAYLQKADIDHAIEQFRAGLTLEPDNAHLHYDLGLAYKLKDDLAAAVPEFERSAALDPELPDPAYTLGVIYMQQGRSAEAAASLKRATTLQPGNGDAWALLGNVLKDSGDGPSAAEALRHAIALQPDQPSLHIQLAALESQAGQTVEAAAERKTAADLSRAAMNRQRAEFALKSGRTLLEQNKVDDAVVQLTNAAHAEPQLAEPHRLLAEAYMRQGKAADAAIERQQADALSASKAQ